MTHADLHCHSSASQESRLGVQTALGLPECATPPEEVYDLAKRRGMDFVTITDHDTISGVLEIADRPDVFVSEELTAWFRGEPQAVHVLCWGIAPHDHDWLRAHSGDVEECAEYLHGNGIASALAHPFYAVAAPLTARHRRRLARLFPNWETRNGSRAPELNMPAAIYIETHGVRVSGDPTITPGSTSGGPGRRHRPRRLRNSFSAACVAARRRRAATRVARRSGRTPRWPSPRGRSGGTTAARRPTLGSSSR